MNDLNLVTFFKASFSIRAEEQNVDILWELVCAIRTWLMDKYNKNSKELVPFNNWLWSKFKKYCSIIYSLDPEKVVYCQSITYTSEKSSVMHWACRITESPAPEYDHASRQWMTEIVYKEHEGDGHFDLVVKYRDRAGYIGHYEPQPVITVPRLVKLILQHKKLYCHSKNIPLRAYPIELNTGDGAMLQDLIFNPVRDLPLIYISARKNPEKWTDIGELLISPDNLTKCVMGNAFVYYSKSIEFSEEMDYLLGYSYQCNNGNIRVYFPRIDRATQPDDPRRHRLLFASTIEQWGEEEVLSIFRKALAQNSDFFRRVSDYDTCCFMKNREYHEKQMLEVIKNRDERIADIEKNRDEQIASLKNASEEEREQIFEMAMEDFDNLSKEHEGLVGEYDKLEKERDKLKEEVYNLNSQISMLNQKNAGGWIDENSKKLLCRLAHMPETCVDVARIIEAMFPNTIVFTPKAYKSLEECKTKPGILWALLYGMATDFFKLLQSNPAGAAQEFALQAGVQYARGAGSNTRKDSVLMRGYQDTYDNKTFSIETHFKKGNDDRDPQSIRVYFAWEPSQCQCIVVGHCGDHIDNSTTRKLH